MSRMRLLITCAIRTFGVFGTGSFSVAAPESACDVLRLYGFYAAYASRAREAISIGGLAGHVHEDIVARSRRDGRTCRHVNAGSEGSENRECDTSRNS